MDKLNHKTVLVTGGCGFIGSHFIARLLTNYEHIHIINLDLLTYAGDPTYLKKYEQDPRYQLIVGDINDNAILEKIFPKIDYCVHFAAQTHVDRSISEPDIFYQTNVMGTQKLLNFAHRYTIERFIHISTDEVYGSLEQGYAHEQSPLNPSSPYSSSKASADLIVLSYYKTYGLPVLVTRCSNNYGPHQYPEKLIPLCIKKLMNKENLTLYGDGLHKRDWIYVTDHCCALERVLQYGKIGQIYNIGSGQEKTNVQVAKDLIHLISPNLEKLNSKDALEKISPIKIDSVSDRLGHDRRYALDCQKIQKQCQWQAQTFWEQGLKQTIQWYKNRLKAQ